MRKTTEMLQQASALIPLGFTAYEKAYRVYGQHGAGAITRVKTANREAAAWSKVQAIAGEHGYTVERQGDPRGIPFYVVAGTRRVAVLWI